LREISFNNKVVRNINDSPLAVVCSWLAARICAIRARGGRRRWGYVAAARLPAGCPAVASSRGNKACPATASTTGLVTRLARCAELVNFARVICAAGIDAVLERVISLSLMIEANALLVVVGKRKGSIRVITRWRSWRNVRDKLPVHIQRRDRALRDCAR